MVKVISGVHFQWIVRNPITGCVVQDCVLNKSFQTPYSTLFQLSISWSFFIDSKSVNIFKYFYLTISRSALYFWYYYRLRTCTICSFLNTNGRDLQFWRHQLISQNKIIKHEILMDREVLYLICVRQNCKKYTISKYLIEMVRNIISCIFIFENVSW